MRVHDFSGKLGLVVVNLKQRTQLRKHDGNDKEGGRGCHPVPKQRLRRGSLWPNWMETSINPPTQRCRGGLIELSEVQPVTQQIQVNKLGGTAGAMPEVTLEFGGAATTQLTVEILLKQRIGKVTPHGQAPCEEFVSAEDNWRRARESEDMTVPRGIDVIVAISL